MPGYCPASIRCFSPSPLGPPAISTNVGHPVEGGEHFVLDRARLDDARPADDHRSAHAAFPGAQLAALERRDAAVREGDGLGAVVGGEHDDGVVELAHVFELLEHDADVVIHLLHAGFVDAPVLAAGLAHHGHVLVRQHGRDVHARRVVPDEERLVGLPRIVAVEEVDDLGRDFLVHGLRSLQGQRALVLARLVFASAVGGLARRAPDAVASGRPWSWDPPRREPRAGRGSACSCTAARRVCWVGVLLMSGKLTPCIASR